MFLLKASHLCHMCPTEIAKSFSGMFLKPCSSRCVPRPSVPHRQQVRNALPPAPAIILLHLNKNPCTLSEKPCLKLPFLCKSNHRLNWSLLGWEASKTEKKTFVWPLLKSYLVWLCPSFKIRLLPQRSFFVPSPPSRGELWGSCSFKTVSQIKIFAAHPPE